MPDTPDSPSERKRGSGVRLVYDALRDEILELVLPPGTPIDEVALAERFGMSRTPVREALLRLAGEGLVETLPNRSAIVANIDFLNLHHFFDAMTLMYRVTTRLAALNRSDADLAAIRACQAQFAAAVEAQDALAMIATNRAFHAAIAEAGGNPTLAALLEVFRSRSRNYQIFGSPSGPEIKRASDQGHRAIAVAIAARDSGAAGTAATGHVAETERWLRRLQPPPAE